MVFPLQLLAQLAVHSWLEAAVRMPTLMRCCGLLFRHLFRHPDVLVPCLLRLLCLLAVAVEVGRGVRGSLGILGGPQPLLEGERPRTLRQGGVWAGAATCLVTMS